MGEITIHQFIIQIYNFIMDTKVLLLPQTGVVFHAETLLGSNNKWLVCPLYSTLFYLVVFQEL